MSDFTGYRPDLEDIDFLEAVSDPLPAMFDQFYSGSMDSPEEIDPRPWHQIEDQAEMGSCQGHALTSVCEMSFHIATEQVTQFSPMFGYLSSQKLDNLLGSDNGSTLSGGRKAAMEFGSCPLEVFPYPRPVRYSAEFAPGCWEAAEPYKIQSSSICRGYDDVFKFLASGQGGVEIGIMWGDGLEPDREGVIERYQPGNGGHAICFLGYSRRQDDKGRNYLWLANSWSPRWGNRGWAEVSPRACDEMARHQGNVMIGLSDLTVDDRHARRIPWTQGGGAFG